MKLFVVGLYLRLHFSVWYQQQQPPAVDHQSIVTLKKASFALLPSAHDSRVDLVPICTPPFTFFITAPALILG